MKRFLYSLYGIPLVCVGVALIVAAFFVGNGLMNVAGPLALVLILIGIAGFCHKAARISGREQP